MTAVGGLRRRLASVHGNHRQIALSAVVIGVLTMVAKLFVAAREAAIAWRYGVSPTVDAYQLSLTIVTWVPMMLTGVITVVLVPRLVAVAGEEKERAPFLAEINGTMLAIALASTIGIFFLATPAARLLMTANSGDAVRLTASFARQMAPVGFAIIIGGYFATRLQARERFSYTITEALPALVIASVLLAPGSAGSTGMLTFGTVIGYLVQLAVLVLLVVWRDPPLGSVRLGHQSPEWQSVHLSSLVMIVGQLLISAANPIDQGFAARLGPGAVATLGYATRIITLFTGLATVVIGRALLPVLSRAVANGEIALGRRQALQWSVLMVAAAAAGSIVLWAAAPSLVSLLFERGAFGAAATAAVASAIRWGVVQLPFFFGGIVFVQWYAANRRLTELLMINAACLVAKALGNAVLAPLFGVDGIMLSTAIMYAVSSLALFATVMAPRRWEDRGPKSPAA